jgi:hypothetical protein
MTPDLPVELTLMAQLRAIEQRGDFYAVLHRGDPHHGVILCVWRCAGETHLYAQERNIDGVLGWREVRNSPSAKAEGPRTMERGPRVKPEGQGRAEGLEFSCLDRYIARARDRDPDCWVVEVDTRQNQFPLEGPVFTDADH